MFGVPGREFIRGAPARDRRAGVWRAAATYALDMHTAAGRAMGRGKRHFREVGAIVSPELPDRDATYRQRLVEILDAEGEESSTP